MEWSGRVTDVEGDSFSAILTPPEGDPDRMELLADFSMSQCGIKVEPDDLIVVTPEAVTKVPPRVWSQQEIDEIMARARERHRRLMRNVC